MAQYNSVAARPHLEAVAPRPGGGWLQARFALGSDWLAQSARIETEAARFRSLKYLRGALKTTIGLVLGVVLLLGLLLTFFLAFAVARRLVTPISELILSARRIGAGDYAARVPERTGSELGALGSAFNRMGAELEQARAGLQQAVRTAEARRGSLALVQERMSSGLLTLDADGAISALNGAGAQRLGVEPEAIEGLQPEALGQHWPALAQFARVLAEARGRAAREWLAEVNVQRDDGASQPLLLRGAHLPEPVGGMVVLFDDLGEVGRAQRETAWREVARRLAHEIKNPLTPIQLAAERLRRRCMDKLPPEDREVLDKATTTIVAQVEALKTMVNAFSDYAQAPQLTLRRLDPDALVREVVGLYESGAGQVHFTLALAAEGEVRIEGDAGRLRQLLHNLIRNAEEAAAPRAVGLHIVSRHLREGERAWYELQLRDDGPGIPEQLLDRLFEPYVTSKPKGTGLGLAIVRRIAEEHGGNIRAWNHAEGGAVLTVRLPLAATEALAKPS